MEPFLLWKDTLSCRVSLLKCLNHLLLYVESLRVPRRETPEELLRIVDHLMVHSFLKQFSVEPFLMDEAHSVVGFYIEA